MLGPCLITRLVLDEFIVDKADAVTGEYSQDLTVAFTLRYHGAIRLSESLVRLFEMRKIARIFHADAVLCRRLAQPHYKVTTIVENVET